MSGKRSHDEFDDGGRDSPGPNDDAFSKKRKFETRGKHKAKEGSTEYARKRIRNIERLFQKKDDLPGNVRTELEREVASLKISVSDKSFQKKRSAMIGKYHMVRFFERKKAMRLVKQLKRKIETTEDPEELQELRKSLHVAEVDEAYAVHHPHAEPYISLYRNIKSSEKGEADGTDKVATAKSALESERPEMWKTVEIALKGGPDALRALREWQSAVEGAKKKPTKKAATSPASKTADAAKKSDQSPAVNKKPVLPLDSDGKGLNRRERRKLMHEAAKANESEDDGGFFEI